VLIVLADQMGRSVGDMYAGAIVPALMLVGLYLLFIVAIILLRPSWMPALPVEARIYREPDGSGGYRSLIVLLAACAAAGYAWSRVHDTAMKAWLDREMASPGDEVLILSMTVAAVLAMAMAGLDRLLKLGLLSRLARQVTFVLIPPLVLIFLVLGTIFLGVATPTEGGAMGAVGALVMATGRGKFSFSLLRQALDQTARLSTFVLFILIGSTVFSFTFNAADGHFWVEHLFSHIPGGALGFLIVVNLLVFVLGMFLDFFEIAFIVIPMLTPVAEKLLPTMLPGVPLDAVMIWFGVIIAMNMQTSFLTPPFGFALFYLRSVAPKADYDDRITGQRIPAVTTGQIYKGSIAFIMIQLVMVAALIAFPNLVTGGIDQGVKVDPNKALSEMIQDEAEDDADPMMEESKEDGLPAPDGEETSDDPDAADQPADGAGGDKAETPDEAEGDPSDADKDESETNADNADGKKP
jgi:TRAP-type mannitol/chloroaromatic compound transport system permease large subunit